MADRFMVLGSLSSSLKNFRGPLVSAIKRCGYEVHAVAPGLVEDYPTREWLSAQNVGCHNVRLDRAGFSPIADLRTAWGLFQVMRKVRPKYLFAYTIKPVIWGVVAAWCAGTPNRIALISGLGYAFTGEAKGKRALVQYVARGLYRFALRRATLIFFQNADDQKDFKRLGLLPSNIQVVVVNGSGVDIESFSPTEFPEKPIRFLLIARLLGDKGIREYASAAAKVKSIHPEVECHLVGGLDENPDGIPEKEVRSWHEEGHIVWDGPLADVRPAIAASHVYVLPSYREGTPRTVLEAMAMGRPVITTDAPGCRETVKDGHNGYLVSISSSSSLAEAMLRFIEQPDLVTSMGARAREIAEEKYDVRKVNKVMIRAMGLDV